MWDFIAHLLVNVKSLSEDVHLPTYAHANVKKWVSLLGSQEMGSTLVSFPIIFEAPQSDSSQKNPGINLSMALFTEP